MYFWSYSWLPLQKTRLRLIYLSILLSVLTSNNFRSAGAHEKNIKGSRNQTQDQLNCANHQTTATATDITTAAAALQQKKKMPPPPPCSGDEKKNRIKNEDEAHQWKKILQRLHKFSSIYFKRSKLESQERPSWRYDFLLSHSFFPLTLSLSLSLSCTHPSSVSISPHTHTHILSPFFLSLPPTPTYSIALSHPFLVVLLFIYVWREKFLLMLSRVQDIAPLSWIGWTIPQL